MAYIYHFIPKIVNERHTLSFKGTLHNGIVKNIYAHLKIASESHNENLFSLWANDAISSLLIIASEEQNESLLSFCPSDASISLI